jgi:hypothetical protein
MMPTCKSILVGLCCSLLIVIGVFSTPAWEFGPFASVAFALVILFYSSHGKLRFHLALSLSLLSVSLTLIASVMFGFAEDATFNLASFNALEDNLELNTISHQWFEEMSPSRYWKLLLNASIAVMIIIATFCLLLPRR